eukprot:TRINITY_DN23917_c0_g4_i2.p3 TRINITY_DN23917_c0_g4~~TRINITY_DN23917_c0_g4_i2.p3  ORF type:complete len:118 (-),score=2.23 TRINITY_DN23917_c0_g4_i2:154-507(-)
MAEALCLWTAILRLYQGTQFYQILHQTWIEIINFFCPEYKPLNFFGNISQKKNCFLQELILKNQKKSKNYFFQGKEHFFSSIKDLIPYQNSSLRILKKIWHKKSTLFQRILEEPKIL